MLVLLRASADRASPTSRLRPRPVPVMATEEPVLRPQLMGVRVAHSTHRHCDGCGGLRLRWPPSGRPRRCTRDRSRCPSCPAPSSGPMSWCACSATITASHRTRLRAAASAGAEAHSRCSAPCARSPHPGARPRRAGELRALCRGQPARGGCDTSRGGHVRGFGRPAESGAKAVGLALRLGHWPGPRQGCSGRRARAAAHAAALPRTQVERGSSRARATVGLGLGLLTVGLGALAGQGHGSWGEGRVMSAPDLG